MSGLHKTVRKWIPKEVSKADPVGTKIDTEVGKAWGSLTPKMPVAAEEKVIPLPDEEELERQRRRKSRGGGRASTVLTSNDEGLGG